MIISFGDRCADIRVRSERIACNNMPRCHSHTEYELYCLTEGERYLFVENKFYHVLAGDVFIIAPEIDHRTLDVKPGGYSRLVVTIPKKHLPEGTGLGSDVFLARPTGRDAELIGQEIAAIDEFALKGEGNLAAYSAVLRLLQLVLGLANIAEETTVASPTLGRVSDILSYIDKSYSEPISLISLSEKFYLSEFYLCRLFKEYTGRTVLEYITSVRLRQAQKLLLSTNMAVAKIAGACGFGSVSAFGSAFRRAFGCSPREWRAGKS